MRHTRPLHPRVLAFLGLGAACLLAGEAWANALDEEKEIFFIRPLITEPAWTRTGVYLHTTLFDLPNAPSRPSAQVGFVLTPGLTWSVLDILELNLGFPLVLNPDETGDRELAAAELDPSLESSPAWDATPDFDMPGLFVGLKANVLGNPREDRFLLAVGVDTSLPLAEKWATSFMPPKNMPGRSTGWRVNPYVSLGYDLGRFSPQLQLGAAFALQQESYAAEAGFPPQGTDLDGPVHQVAFFFNLALPYAFVFERTALMLELNGAFGDQGSQLFLTPAVAFMPKDSPMLISFACMIPVADEAFRGDEGFRVLIHFSYRLDMLSIPAPGSDAGPEGEDQPPAG